MNVQSFFRKVFKRKNTLEGKPLRYPSKCDKCKRESSNCKKLILSNGTHACVY